MAQTQTSQSDAATRKRLKANTQKTIHAWATAVKKNNLVEAEELREALRHVAAYVLAEDLSFNDWLPAIILYWFEEPSHASNAVRKTLSTGSVCYAEPTAHNALPENAVPQILDFLKKVEALPSPIHMLCAHELGKAVVSARIDFEKPHVEGLINARLATEEIKASVYFWLQTTEATKYLTNYTKKLAQPESPSPQRVASTVELVQLLVNRWDSTLKELVSTCVQLTGECLVS